ncbi:hypothetical protein B0H14DRAFT_3432534 [Mycena olivaceomarginata]|nr:hypothetical protein B0H14DRAFT_3432534 [Mycena olivaceomarginata]
MQVVSINALALLTHPRYTTVEASSSGRSANNRAGEYTSIALRNPKPRLQSAAESCALCPIRVVAHRVFELRLGGWAGWQTQVVGAAGYNTSIFTRPAGAALNFICFGINIHYVVLDACSGRTVPGWASTSCGWMTSRASRTR